MRKILCFLLVMILASSQQFYHSFDENPEKYQPKQINDRRLLQNTEIGSMRIHVDYTQFDVGNDKEKNLIKRAMNISSNFYYQLLKVQRLEKLTFPKG